jgi:hypothetical protein
MPLIRLIDLEQGLPSADEAKRRLQEAIEAARHDRVRVLKVIHGYGSTGSGGRLRVSIRAALRIAKQCGDIKLFVTGEDWRVSDELAWKILSICPELKKDSDLGRRNPGITFVLL